MKITPIEALDREAFVREFNETGFVVVGNVFGDGFIKAVIPELESAIEHEAAQFGGSGFLDYGMLRACPIYGGHFLDVPGHEPFIRPFDWILGDTCYIYVYTSSSMPPSKGNYATRIHVDRPHFIPGYTEAMGSLILLNDFTEENGATWILPGSHTRPDAPDEKEFYERAIRLIAPRGSVIYFHLRLWHAGGVNLTRKWRHCLGVGMIRAGMKQRIDLPRAMQGVDVSGLTDTALQKLGFFSQTPASLEEYYTPPDKRKYRQRSEWQAL